MSDILKGKPVADAITEQIRAEVIKLNENNINPTLAILRVGEREDDLSYERGAVKRCENVGITIQKEVLSVDVPEERFFDTLQRLNEDDNVHGILMFRPLPKHINEEKARRMLSPAKDVDGCTDLSLAGVFTGSRQGFPPCTAQAAMEILHHYNIPVAGKKAVVIGRSLVIGRPVAMLLMQENATVTICHTKTQDLAATAREADILICASGQMESVDDAYVNEKQTLIDVGISWNEAKQKLCGDACFEKVEEKLQAITPVPGGVGAVTTSVLAKHVVLATKRSKNLD